MLLYLLYICYVIQRLVYQYNILAHILEELMAAYIYTILPCFDLVLIIFFKKKKSNYKLSARFYLYIKHHIVLAISTNKCLATRKFNLA
jgi:hypothetical protein